MLNKSSNWIRIIGSAAASLAVIAMMNVSADAAGKTATVKDGWGNEYQYLSPGAHGKFDLYSLGADGREGGEGMDQDIVSWIVEQ